MSPNKLYKMERKPLVSGYWLVLRLQYLILFDDDKNTSATIPYINVLFQCVYNCMVHHCIMSIQV